MKSGDIAPDFVLKDEKGNDFQLYKNLERQILLVFYPKDNTPVCSLQLAGYNNNLDEFISNGVKIVGISTDSIQSHSEFCGKLKLNFPLLADVDKSVSRQYCAVNFLGMNKRLVVLIGTDKKIHWTASTLQVTYLKTEEILDKVKSLNRKEMT
jgi:peroxiredoxin Q/BCP